MKKRHVLSNIFSYDLLAIDCFKRRSLLFRSLKLYSLSALFLMLIAIPRIEAAQVDNTQKLIEYLTQEKNTLSVAIQEEKQPHSQPLDQASLKLQKQRNKIMLAMIQARIASLDSFLINQQKQQQNLSSRLKKSQQLLLGQAQGAAVQERITHINQLINVNNNAIHLITENLALARSNQDLLLAESRQLEVWQAKLDEQQQVDGLQKRIKDLDLARSRLYDQNIKLQQDTKEDENFHETLTIEAKVLLNNQAIILIQYRITQLELQIKLIKSDYLLIRMQDMKTIQSVIDTYKSAINQLVLIDRSLKQMIDLLKNEQVVVSDSHLKQQFKNIQQTASLRLVEINAQLSTLQKGYVKKQQELRKHLSVRQGLTVYHLDNWSTIAQQVLHIPVKLYNYTRSLGIKIIDNYAWHNVWLAVLFWVSLGVILFILLFLRILLRSVALDQERSRLSGLLYDGLLILINRNIPHLALLSIVLVTCFLNQLPFNNYHLLMNLLLVWITFRSVIIVARLVLLENIKDSSGHDTRLYYRLKWLMLFGGWSTALMVLSHELPLSFLLQDIFNRLFMLFLLAVSLVAWKSKDVIPFLLRPILKSKKRYFRNAISLFAMLVPLILLTTALIGLVGYIYLAWTLSLYQAYILLLVTSYVLVRGLLFDALELLSEWMISSLHNGWLWIEVFLKPLDKIIRVVIFLVSIVILFQLMGWSSDAVIMENLNWFIHFQVVNSSGVHITVLSIIQFVILLCIFIWAAKWTREFSYRWLYRDARDDGIRNSISVFTQYAVILIGVFITLRALGLDFSGMSMVLGGLAVGMGFGLRDFASNIVGGLMLLIERPVREGDVITLGEYEGRVAHIGIRSMRVSSWDNMEVLIPNAETFNKPFTNWTHQDNIVRTVVPIKVNRSDDPSMIQQLILDVLYIVPEILTVPEPQVFLKQIDEALIEFEARYYINIQLYTRFEIRSKALFAIMAQFKAAGIKPPIPPFSVQLQDASDEENA